MLTERTTPSAEAAATPPSEGGELFFRVLVRVFRVFSGSALKTQPRSTPTARTSTKRKLELQGELNILILTERTTPSAEAAATPPSEGGELRRGLLFARVHRGRMWRCGEEDLHARSCLIVFFFLYLGGCCKRITSRISWPRTKASHFPSRDQEKLYRRSSGSPTSL